MSTHPTEWSPVQWAFRHSIARATCTMGLVLSCLVLWPTRSSASPGRSTTATPLVTDPTWISLPPQTLDVGARPTLDHVRSAMHAHDTSRALGLAHRLVAGLSSGTLRDTASFLIGVLEGRRGHSLRAVEAFGEARLGGGPLAALATWSGAQQNLIRGDTWAVVRECAFLGDRWATSSKAASCLRMSARALADEGRASQARQAAHAHDRQYPEEPISEQIELRLVLRKAADDPQGAIPTLRRLAVSHSAPLTGRIADDLLEELARRGHPDAELPDDIPSLRTRAISLRETGRLEEARQLWRDLARRAEDDPELDAWLQHEATTFGWRARDWPMLLSIYRPQYASSPSGELAWRIFRVLGRAGRWSEAADWGLRGMAEHDDSSRWRHRHEEVGRALLLAGRYDEAATQLDTASTRGGWAGKRTARLAAFSIWMAGRPDLAVGRYDVLIAEAQGHVTHLKYWRAKALGALGRLEDARADHDWILSNDPRSWYAIWIAQDRGHPSVHPLERDGRWPGPPLATRPTPRTTHLSPRSTVPIARRAVPVEPLRHADVALPPWPMRSPEPHPVLALSRSLEGSTLPPPDRISSPSFDPAEARETFRRFVQTHRASWPVLDTIRLLADLGLYDMAGPMFADFYEQWYRAYRYSGHRLHAVARTIPSDAAHWRPLFLHTRDHHHTTRFFHGVSSGRSGPEADREDQRLSWPLAHARFVWEQARRQDMDPLLVLGLMRQESRYDANAISRAGARGAMQILPRTGHQLANIHRDLDFTAGDLEDPIVAIELGVDYLSRLNDRFDGVFPLAVAAYNGGPHNVSSWLSELPQNIPLDAFVEHVPFDETRDYVKRVTANYATYAALYGPTDGQVVLPAHPLGDHADIVDF